jgi:hypothetical protein
MKVLARRKEDIMKEVNVYLIQNEIDEQGKNWINHVDRMIDERIAKQALHYIPKVS